MSAASPPPARVRLAWAFACAMMHYNSDAPCRVAGFSGAKTGLRSCPVMPRRHARAVPARGDPAVTRALLALLLCATPIADALAQAPAVDENRESCLESA